MKWRLAAITFCLALADVASGLDAESRRLAERYLTVLERNPTQQTVFDRLWKIHADAGEIESLIEACRMRAAENPILYARLLQRAGRAAEAKQVLGDAAEGGNIGAAEMLAGMLEEEGEIRTAADLLQKIAAVHENQRVLVRLGELLQKAGESEKSRIAFERAAALAPDDLVLRKRLAAASAQAGDWEAAVDHLRVIAQRGSPSERFAALSEISLRLEEGGKVDEALAAQESLLGLMGPDHWQLHSARRRLLNLHQENRSLQTLEKRWSQEAEASPQNPLLALRMAEFYEFQGDETLRRDWLIKAATLLPKDLRLACEVASLDLSLGHHEAAAERYDKVLAARPNDGDLALLRAEVSALLGQEADAEMRVEDYLAARENDDAATARAIDFYRRMRLFAPLERKLTAKFRAHPSDEQAVSELARYYLDQRRDREAVECLSRFDVSMLDNEAAAAVALRFSELLKGSEAREQEQRWAQIAFEKDPSKPEYALRLADLLEGAGETEAVVGILRQASESYKSGPPREDLDRRLFLALQANERGGLEEKGKPVTTAAVKDMIASLEDHAVSSQSEAAWLRLARWLLWTEAGSKPAAALRRGLEAIPQSKALSDAESLILKSIAVIARRVCGFLSRWRKILRIGRLLPTLRSPSKWRVIGLKPSKFGNELTALRRQVPDEQFVLRSLTQPPDCSFIAGVWIFLKKRASPKETLRRVENCLMKPPVMRSSMVLPRSGAHAWNAIVEHRSGNCLGEKASSFY
jgi:thioredoxin-like negative regulator of GroEL